MRRIKNRYRRPKTPWNSIQIKENKELISKYGLRRQKEILVAREILRRFRERARTINATKNKTEERVLLEQMARLGLLEKGKAVDDVLALTVDDILNRRLQTVVFKKGLAKTMKQARQLVVHHHVAISGRKTNVPSYIVLAEEEGKIGLYKENGHKTVKHEVKHEPKHEAKHAAGVSENG